MVIYHLFFSLFFLLFFFLLPFPFIFFLRIHFRHFTHPQKIDNQNLNFHFNIYKERKVIIQAVRIENFKVMLEKMAYHEDNYVLLGDGKIFVTIWSQHLSMDETLEMEEEAHQEAKELFLRLVDQDPSLDFQPETFKVWTKVAQFREQRTAEEMTRDYAEMRESMDLPVTHSQME